MKRKIKYLLIFALSGLILASGCTNEKEEEPADTRTASELAGKTEDSKKAEDTPEISKESIEIGCMAMTEYGASLIAKQMESLGYTVKISVFDGNDLPAKALAAGDIDALLGNHLPWIKTFNENNNTNLTMVEPYFYYSPYALYSTKYKTIKEIPDGAQISIPNDPTNMERSLLMLQDLGMITLGEKLGEFYSTADIAENIKNIQFVEVEMTATAANIQDVDAGFSAAVPIQQSGVLKASEYLYLDPTSENYPVGLVVAEENANAEWAVETMKRMKQEEVMKEFDDTVEGMFIQFDK